MYSEIIKYLQNNNYKPYQDYYSTIDLWIKLWKGKTDFHKYKVVYDDVEYDKEMYSLGMPKRIAEDWASICWSEKDKIASSSTNQKYLEKELEKLKFYKNK